MLTLTVILIFTFSETYFEIELVKKLEIVIEKQRNEIKKLDQSVLDYKTENEEVSILSEARITGDFTFTL